MKRIASFDVDHRTIEPGIYLSRTDGDVTTYDLRTRKPNSGDVMSPAVMHSTEHLFATLIRNSDIADNVIYFGPMGCQTGYYLLVRGHDHAAVIDAIKRVLAGIVSYTGTMPGYSEIECGNYRNLDVELARGDCKRYLAVVSEWTEERLKYND